MGLLVQQTLLATSQLEHLIELGSNNLSTAHTYRNIVKVFHSEVAIKSILAALLKDLGFPLALIPLNDVTEVGYNKQNGFLWVLRKKKEEHNLKAIKQVVSFVTEVTAMVELQKIRKMMQVKVREMLLWLSVVEICIDDPASGKIIFKSRTCLADNFLVFCV
ncbi:uncharacterized protein LOC144713497 [Wolffia australiana]